MPAAQPQSLAFDIYGTLVDVQAISTPLAETLSLPAERARRFAELWREKQLEYTFRRALMRRYEPLPVVTRQALRYTAASLRVAVSESDEETLLKAQQKLPAFPDAASGLDALRAAGHRLTAFSNGPESSLKPLLQHNDLFDKFDRTVSADAQRTFKPDPGLYAFLVTALSSPALPIWVVSSNPFDAISAKHAGLRAAWIKRSDDKIYDPWGLEPDLAVPDVLALAEALAT